jgi:hypothetical protein
MGEALRRQEVKTDFAKLADLYAPLVAKVYTSTDTDVMAAARMRAMLLAALGHHDAQQSYLPRLFPNPPSTLEELFHVHEDGLEAAVAKLSRSAVRQLSEHREKVTYIESQNAQRLLVLATNARASAADPKDAGMAAGFGGFIAEHWDVDPGVAGDLRSWSERVTRCYRVLPRSWREVNMPVVAMKRSDEGEA